MIKSDRQHCTTWQQPVKVDSLDSMMETLEYESKRLSCILSEKVEVVVGEGDEARTTGLCLNSDRMHGHEEKESRHIRQEAYNRRNSGHTEMQRACRGHKVKLYEYFAKRNNQEAIGQGYEDCSRVFFEYLRKTQPWCAGQSQGPHRDRVWRQRFAAFGGFPEQTCGWGNRAST